MRNNSTRLKGKRKLQLHNIKVSSTTVWRYVTNKGWKALKRKKAKKNLHTLYQRTDRLANSRDGNPVVTIWIIVDKTTYKDPASKTLD